MQCSESIRLRPIECGQGSNQRWNDNYVGWVCCLVCPLLREVWLRDYSGFPFFLKIQFDLESVDTFLMLLNPRLVICLLWAWVIQLRFTYFSSTLWSFHFVHTLKIILWNKWNSFTRQRPVTAHVEPRPLMYHLLVASDFFCGPFIKESDLLIPGIPK